MSLIKTLGLPVIQSAGGLVFNDDYHILLIFKKGKWDLPKGKLDAGETIRECAIREVQEETGVVCSLGEKICHTWHTYTRNQKYVLKKTHWFHMSCISDDLLAPQKEERIEKALWMDQSQVDAALMDSYETIKYVFESANQAR